MQLHLLLPALFVAGLLATPAIAQTNAVVAVRGTVEKPLSLSLADLQAMPRTKLKAVEKDGHEAMFEGVALFEVVSRARPILTEHCCSNAINTVVIIKAADNYQALFSLPELDPKFSEGAILLADRRDGEPLDSAHAPLQIVVPDDKVHVRWVRQVNLIEVMPIGDLHPASTNSTAR